MSEAVKLVIIGGMFGVLGSLVTAWWQTRTKPDAYATINSINSSTIENLARQVDNLIKRDDEKEQRIDFLEKELRRHVNGYARLYRYIKERIPDEDIPDFLITTDPALYGKKK